MNSCGHFSDAVGERRFIVEHDYFHDRRYREDVAAGGLEMSFHGIHRPLQKLSTVLEDHGFVVEAIREIGNEDGSQDRAQRIRSSSTCARGGPDSPHSVGHTRGGRNAEASLPPQGHEPAPGPLGPRGRTGAQTAQRESGRMSEDRRNSTPSDAFPQRANSQISASCNRGCQRPGPDRGSTERAVRSFGGLGADTSTSSVNSGHPGPRDADRRIRGTRRLFARPCARGS